MTPPDHVRVGYVLKMYPRFSETFILGEILAHEAQREDLHIVSLRPPVDGRFHGVLAEVRAPVTYLTHRGVRAGDLWELLRQTTSRFPRTPAVLDQLVAADAADAAQACELAALVEDHALTHLHAHFGSVATTVARLASLLTGVPFTFTAHAKDIFLDSVDLADQRRKLLDAAACVTVSDYNVDYLQTIHGAAAARVVRIYNGLDLDRFAYSPPNGRAATIVAVGRLVEKKGFTDLVTACSILAAEGRAFRCDIIGAGPLHDALAGQIQRERLQDRVHLMGPMPQHEVQRIVQRAAAFAAPCVVASDGNRDGLPTVLVEAMALGTPCVATDVTGVPEVLRHDETGLMVDQHDSIGLARALARLLDDTALRMRLAESAHALVETEFDGDRQARRLRELFTPSRTLLAVAR